MRLLRSPPLEWDSPGSAREPDPPPGPVDVIIPIYGAAAELAACLASVRRSTDLARHRLVWVVDGPQPAAVEEVLAAHADLPPASLQVLRNPSRLGFVGSVNRGMRGMAASERDVLLLNSDTEVSPGWVERLQAAAYSAPEVATVTPFSNDATLCSLPRQFAANALPAGYDTARFAQLVERASLRTYPRIPTGVGVCLYIKRKVLAHIGLFDQERFGLGYGEESEFCFRALKAGYRHVLDDSTFIYHVGKSSFGPSRRGRVRAAHRALAEVHPEYLPTIAAFMRRDPLRPARERVIAALRSSLPSPSSSRSSFPAKAPRRVLHLVHGWPPWNQAGTEVYARGLALRQAAWREVTVYARISPGQTGDAVELWDGGARVRLVVNDFTQRNPLSRNALHNRLLAADFSRLLAEVEPDLLHVHHLAGHAAGLLDAVPRHLPVLYQLQDWWGPCARANLLDAERRLCPGPTPTRCSRCLPLTGRPPAVFWNRAFHSYRQRLMRRTLARADALVMGSQAILESHRALGFLPAGVPVHVLPYGVEIAPPLPRRPPALPLRFGFIGSLLPHKGAHVAVAAMSRVSPALASLTVWGDPSISPDYTDELERLRSSGPGAVRFAGRFAEENKAEVLAGIDVLLLPSLGLESFGLVAREAIHHGVPVLASRRGALTELFAGQEDAPCGALFTPGDVEELRVWIERLAGDPAQVVRWQEARRPVRSMDDHAVEIEAVYERLLAGRTGS